MFSEKYADKFGFTHDEVSVLLENYGLTEKIRYAKDWHDSY